MTFGSTFGRTFSPTFQPHSLAPAVASSWWLSGGIDPANCIVAYQPKGAASYAASKVNLTGNTDYNAVDGAAYPSWDGSTGWTFTGASSQYLNSGVIPTLDQTWSAIVRMYATAMNNSCIFFSRSGKNLDFGLFQSNFTSFYPHNTINTLITITSVQNSDVTLAVVGKRGYKDGYILEGTIADSTGTGTKSIYIGAGNISGSPNYYYSGRIYALAIYNGTLTGPQVLAIHTAMAAL